MDNNKTINKLLLRHELEKNRMYQTHFQQKAAQFKNQKQNNNNSVQKNHVSTTTSSNSLHFKHPSRKTTQLMSVDSDIDSEIMTTSQSSSLFLQTPRESQISDNSSYILDSGLSGSEYRPMSANSDHSFRSIETTSSFSTNSIKSSSDDKNNFFHKNFGNSTITPENCHKIYQTIYKQTKKREKKNNQEKIKNIVKNSPNQKLHQIKNSPKTSKPYHFISPKVALLSPKSKLVKQFDNLVIDVNNTSQSSCYSSAGSSFLLSPKIPEKIEKPTASTESKNTHPLPELTFIDSKRTWLSMKKRSLLPHYQINRKTILEKHKQVTCKMRAVLIDWMIDVCQVYQLHRETFYLSLDFLSRYMMKTEKPIKRQTLQLIGVTCLFTAAKLEEIYPPKCHEFAYVTDGACNVDDIRNAEIEVCSVLGWKLQPVTAQAWLTLFLQAEQFKKHGIKDENSVKIPVGEKLSSWGILRSESSTSLMSDDLNQSTSSVNSQNGGKIPDPVLTNFQCERRIFIQMCQLMDSCMMDIKCLDYSYGIIAASVIYHFSSAEKMERCTGFSRDEVDSCVRWMSPHAESLLERGLTKQLRSFKRVIKNDWHNIQTHETKLEDVCEKLFVSLKLIKASSLQQSIEIKKKQVLESVNKNMGCSMECDNENNDLLKTIKPNEVQTET